MGIYAPRRAGDVAGAVLVGGADEGRMPTSARGTARPRGVGDDLSDRLYPTRSPARARDRRREPVATAGRLALSALRRTGPL